MSEKNEELDSAQDMSGKEPELAEQAESALHMTRSRLECAEASLRSIGLWPEKPKVLRPAEPPCGGQAHL